MIVKEPWVEQDNYGKVKYAVIKTVSHKHKPRYRICFIFSKISDTKICFFLSTEIPPTRLWSTWLLTKACFYLAIMNLSLRTHCSLNCKCECSSRAYWVTFFLYHLDCHIKCSNTEMYHHTDIYVCIYIIINFTFRPSGCLSFIDHIVGNQPDDEMVSITDWCEPACSSRTAGKTPE